MYLNGKTAVVTGAGKGIGKAIALELATKGANLVVLDFDDIAGLQAVEEIERLGRHALFVKTDVSDFSSMENAKEQTLKRFGNVDILVINAGISIKHSIREITPAEWNNVLNINLNGSFYAIKAFYDEFAKKNASDGGRIIFITSGSAITGTGGGAHYAASKSGQHGLMRTVSKELGPMGVNVNAIAPRVIVTNIFDHLYPTEESKQELMKKIPIGRFGYPQDIANMVCFLSSEEASYIHGQIMLMDGGRTY